MTTLEPVQLEAKLQPVEFGKEQPSIYAIRGGIKFSSAESDAPRRGSIDVRGKAIAVSRDDSVDPPRIALDGDQDGSFHQTEHESGHATLHRMKIDGDNILVEVTNTATKSEYIVREMWQGRIEYGGETLHFVAKRFGEGGILFSDNDSDGVYETFITPDSPVWLGGRGWLIEPNYNERAVSLQATDGTPVEPGFVAPRVVVNSPTNGPPVSLTAEGAVSVILFSRPKCLGCRLLREPLALVQQQFAENESVRFLCISQSSADMDGNRQTICPSFEHFVSSDAWKAYAVRPTPSIIIVDAGCKIIYRKVGHTPKTAESIASAVRAAIKNHTSE